jgi:cysteine desulfuration protein SufE
MLNGHDNIPDGLQTVIEDFQWAEGREKLELLLEYAERLPPLPDWLADEHETMDQVHECMTPVFVYAEISDGGMRWFFDVPPESPTVRGYAALMAEGLDGATPEEILAIPGDFFQAMGLQEVVSFQRIKGISAILAHMKRLALAEMGA